LETARKKPEIQTLDDLFGIPATPAVDVPDGTEYHETVVSMPIVKIRDFSNHPYRVRNDHITQDIVRDIQKAGRIETPAIVRPVPDGYEMISGHRRKLACSLAGLEAMPVIVRSMTDDEAVIAMVSANRQREEVLPSEKAFAYKMWMDALNRQGQRTDLTFSPLGKKYAHEQMSEESGESKNQIFRYIRLTELLPDILEMVDNTVVGDKTKPQMAFRPAVELSYLPKEQQNDLLLTMQSEDRTPSLSQAMQMKQLSAEGKLNMDTTFTLMREEKPNQVEQFKLPRDRIRQFIPKDFDDKKAADLIVKLLEGWYRKRERERDDAR